MQRILVGIIENDDYVEFLVEQSNYKSIAGNIYKGVIKDVSPALQCAFVDIGLKKFGFLHINEIIDRYSKDEKLQIKQPIEKLLKKNDVVMAQVLKENYDDKGPQLTTKFSIFGRRCIYLPTKKHYGFSKKITDKKKCDDILDYLKTTEFNADGFIIRSAAENASFEEVYDELKKLKSKYFKILETFKNCKQLELIYSPNDVIELLLRDYLNEDTEIYCDSEYYLKILEKRLTNFEKCKLIYSPIKNESGVLNIFSEYQKTLKTKVWLKCGGYIKIEETEALTAIDINTGKNVDSKKCEDTIYATNYQAMIEIARQIRLRNLSGIIIVDVLNMLPIEKINILIDTLKNELAKDKIKNIIYYTLETGILQILRRRIKKSISQILLEDCECCGGSGKSHTIETQIINIEQKIRIALDTQKKKQTFTIYLSKYLFDSFINNNIKDKWEEFYNIKIILLKNENYFKLQYEVIEKN